MQIQRQVSTLEKQLDNSKKQVVALQLQLREQALKLPVEQLVRVFLEILQNSEPNDELQKQLRYLYFRLKDELQKHSIIPLSDLEQAKSSIMNMDRLETRLKFYREKLSKATPEEQPYWRALREREISRVLHS